MNLSSDPLIALEEHSWDNLAPTSHTDILPKGNVIRPQAAPAEPRAPSVPCYLRKRNATRKQFIDGLCTCGMTREEKVTAKWEAPFLERSVKYNDMALRCDSPDDDLALAHAGTYLWKVKNSIQWYRRKYFLEPETGIIRYLPRHFHRGHQRGVRLRDILEVREGWKTDVWNRLHGALQRKRRSRAVTELVSRTGGSVLQEDCCFSLMIDKSGKRVSLDLVAPSPQLAALWVRAIKRLVGELRGLRKRDRFIRWAFEQFDKADEDKDGNLTFDECLVLLKLFNVSKTREEVMEIFKASTLGETFDGEPYLNAMTIRKFVFKLTPRTDMDEIYNRYAVRGGAMTIEQLFAFLQVEQHFSQEDCRAFIKSQEFKTATIDTGEHSVSYQGFLFLLRNEFPLLTPKHKTLYQDMTQPLNNYFIASSHNTYLLGRQVLAESSIEGYVAALKRGCRCLELDCWDGDNGEPVVKHGFALTTKIPFRKVLLNGILPNAFNDSEYPIILSLENHCSEEQQARMAFHLADVFGDSLYTDPVDSEMARLPSPEQLKRKIIIKARKKLRMEYQQVAFRATHCGEGTVSFNGEQKGIEQSLANLINICQASQFQGFEKKGKCYEMVSLSENKALQLAESKGMDLLEYNTRRLSRIYPAAMRTDSSNFNPFPFWNCGCQLVALNYQGAGKPVLFNESKFSVNGGCGYVLKPEFLCKVNPSVQNYNPNAYPYSATHSRACQIEVKIISGQNLPTAEKEGKTEVANPYVTVKILGHPAETGKGTTPVVSQNGLNPLWNSSFQFEVIEPDLAFLYFVVKHDPCQQREKPAKLGYSAVPFTSVAQGYRSVTLVDLMGRPLEPSSLLVHIKINKSVES